MNIADILDEYATTRSHHPAIEDDGRDITYGELASALDAAASNLQAAGIAPGDLVAVMLEDSADHLIILCALARAGACIYSLGPNLSASGLTDRLDSITVKAVITRNRPGPARETICLRPEEICQPAAAAFKRPGVSGDHPLLYNQSSGTTGRPKSFFRSHDEFVIWARRYTNAQGWSADDRCLCLTRMSFNVGRSISLAMLRLGATVVIIRSQEPEEFAAFVREKRITYLKLAPSQMIVLMEYAKEKPALFPNLRAMVVGSAPVTNDQRKLARQRLTPNCFEQMGSNEAGLLAFATPADQDAHPQSVGRVIGDIEAEIVDGDDTPLAIGEVGHLRFRAAGYPAGYVDDAQASRRAFRGGWFYPGDLAAINGEGYLFLKGRADDVINNSGIKFYPIEVETVLLSHDAVTEAAVIDWPHDEFGSVAIAFVVLASKSALKELLHYCAQRMGAYKVPVRIVAVAEMPKNPMGKILKRELKQTLFRQIYANGSNP